MSLLAGCIVKNGGQCVDSISNKIKSFACITKDNLGLYKYHILPIKFGCVVMRYRDNFSICHEPLKDATGNILAVLGFFHFSDATPSLESIFERCRDNSPQIIENCEGEFLSVFAESRTGRLHIFNDRFASKPCYTLKTQTSIYFSSNLAFLFTLAQGRRSSDITGLLQMFSYGHTIGEKTIFSDIKRIPPASHLIVEPHELHIKKYWFLEHTPAEDLNPKVYARRTFNDFKKSVEYRANLFENGVIALSGGLDSRLVAYCLPDKNNFSAFTFIDSTHDAETTEVKTAREVSRILGLRHQVRFIPAAITSSISKDLIYLTGGLRSLTHVVKTMSYIEYLRSLGLKYLMGGAPAALLAGSMIPKNQACLNNAGLLEGIRTFIDNYAPARDLKAYLTTVFKKDLIKEYYPSLLSSIYTSFENIKGPTAAHKIPAWISLNRWPAFTFTTPFHDHPDVTETFAHLGYSLCDLVLKFPANWLYGQNFLKYMIYENLIELRNVIYANSGEKLSGEIQNYQWISPASPNRLLKTIKANIKDRIAGRILNTSLKILNRAKSTSPKKISSPPDFLHTVFKTDEKLFQDIEEILHSATELKYILDVAQCMNFIRLFRNGNPVTGSLSRDTDLLGKLSAFCYSYKYLIYHS